MPSAAATPIALACVFVLAVAASPSSAAPAEGADPIAELLREKGLSPDAPAVVARHPAGETPVVEEAAPTLLARVRDGASDLVLQAMGHLGVRYRRGGDSTETGFDCSGFVRHVYSASLGLLLPRSADAQASSTSVVPIDRSELRPGDLVFFNTMRRTFSHVGIYIGDNRFIHSPRSGEEVRTESMATGYWARRFTGARRVVGDSVAVASIPAP
jgi:cell wall-associated NlpC family hydrolase